MESNRSVKKYFLTYIKVLIILSILVNIFNVKSQEKDSKGMLEGNLTDCNLKNAFIVVKGWESDPVLDQMKKVTIDTIRIENNKFIYKYKEKDPRLAYLIFYEKDSLPKEMYFKNPYFSTSFGDGQLILDNSHAKLTISYKNMKRGIIEGSPETDLMFLLSYDRIKGHKYQDATRSIVTNYDLIKEHPRSKYLLSKIYDDRTLYSSLDSVKTIFSLFDQSIRTSTPGKLLKKYIEIQKGLNSEGLIKTFAFYDISGKKYTFKDFIGNKPLGLIIFWASWCGPCRAEIPDLTKLYHKYQDKVSFVSLSIDKKYDNWVNAVKEVKTEWPSLSGHTESAAKVSEMFNIGVVPSYIVVDSNGKIIFNGTGGFVNINGKFRFINSDDISKIFDDQLK